MSDDPDGRHPIPRPTDADCFANGFPGMPSKRRSDARSAPSATPAGNREARLKREPGRPLYAQVEEIIRKRLLDNYWKPGEMLPSEMELADELAVSQGTVRKALNDMVAENLLFRRQGVGTFVSEYTERRALFLYFNLVGIDGDHAMPQSHVLSCQIRTATPDEIGRLEIAPGDEVIAMRRVRELRGRPTIFDRLSLPAARFRNLCGDPRLPENLYRFYQSEFGVTVAKAHERVRAVSASAEEARYLGIAPGAPLLEIDRVAVTIDGRPVEWRVSHCNTEDYVYVADRG